MQVCLSDCLPKSNHTPTGGVPTKLPARVKNRLNEQRRQLALSRRTGKNADRPLVPLFREGHDSSVKLAEVDDYPGVVAVAVKALKDKGVRVDESAFKHPDISNPNKYVMVLRGEAYHLLDALFESKPRRLTRKQRRQSHLRRVGIGRTGRLSHLKLSKHLGGIHKQQALIAAHLRKAGLVTVKTANYVDHQTRIRQSRKTFN
jgi:hypothetical protein